MNFDSLPLSINFINQTKKMKALHILFAFLLVVGSAQAQVDCRPYIPTDEGTEWEMTDYNAKGKVQSKTTLKVLEKVVSGSDLTVKIQAVSYDKKGKEVFTNTFEAYCKDGQFELDMAFRVNGETMKAYKNMDVDMDASEFEIPSMDAAVGTTLEDGTITVKVGNGGMNMFNMKIDVIDRKVEAKEEKTTAAGTFKCLVLSQTTRMKMVMKIETTSKEWYAENVGMIRSETYNKKGKLMGYSELTALSKS